MKSPRYCRKIFSKNMKHFCVVKRFIYERIFIFNLNFGGENYEKSY